MFGLFTRILSGGLTALHFHVMRFWRHYFTVTVISLLVVAAGIMSLRAPWFFTPATVVVAQGESAEEVAAELARSGVLVSRVPLWLILRLSGGDSRMRSGTYRFTEPEHVLSITRRLLTADYGMPTVKLTFVEGVTVREMAAQVHEAIPSISVRAFTEAARGQEGYLFPDTYFFGATSDAASIVRLMRTNFDTQTGPLTGTIAASGHTLADIVIMASLIEKEARTEESRKLVAGILWNRLALNMPLQVDAVFGYIFGRDTYSPSAADLKVDSPYNTYRNRGLPPGPINNPGLAAMEAVLHPTKSTYLYYLTGNDEQMHYAKTFAGHQANLVKYLR